MDNIIKFPTQDSESMKGPEILTLEQVKEIFNDLIKGEYAVVAERNDTDGNLYSLDVRVEGKEGSEVQYYLYSYIRAGIFPDTESDVTFISVADFDQKGELIYPENIGNIIEGKLVRS